MGILQYTFVGGYKLKGMFSSGGHQDSVCRISVKWLGQRVGFDGDVVS